MPIILPPLSPTTPDGIVRCEAMDFYGTPLLSKRQAAVVDGGTTSTLEVVLRYENGEPLNLNDGYGLADGQYPIPAANSTGTTILARFREAISGPVRGAPVEIVDQSQGVVRFPIPEKIVDKPGIYVCDVSPAKDLRPIKIFSYWLWVDPNTWTHDRGFIHGPPTLSSVRATLSDDELIKNLLTEHRAYPLSDVCEAAVRSVRQWNESSPPIGSHSTIYYPYPNLYQEGIQLFLYQMAEEWYRRNHLPYNAGGTSIDDHNRLEQYSRAWQDKYKLFQREMTMIKTRINISLGYGTVGSGYSWGGDYRKDNTWF